MSSTFLIDSFRTFQFALSFCDLLGSRYQPIMISGIELVHYSCPFLTSKRSLQYFVVEELLPNEVGKKTEVTLKIKRRQSHW